MTKKWKLQFLHIALSLFLIISFFAITPTTINAQVTNSWITAINSAAYSATGFRFMNIPNGTFVDRRGVTYPSLLTQYIALGNGTFPAVGKISFLQTYDRQYSISLFGDRNRIFTSIQQKVNNISTNLTKKNIVFTQGPNNFGGPLSAQLAVNKRDFVVVSVTGDVVINQNTLCDLKAIFLVTGSVIVIPDFRTETPGDGCIFAATKNIQFGIPPAPINNPVLVVEGFFFAAEDTYVFGHGAPTGISQALLNSAESRKPLQIVGGVVTNTFTNRKIPSSNANPAVIFEYDPRYKYLFSFIFAENSYSIREELN